MGKRFLLQVIWLLTFGLLLWFTGLGQSSPLSQNLRGIITDQATLQPLTGVRIEILNLSPVKGAISGTDGQFLIADVPVGRYEVKVSYIGYRGVLKSGILLVSGQETYLEVRMEEQAIQGEEVLIEADQRKVNNVAAVVSARSFSVEELRRIPGGVDDPARMIVKFPGISPNADALNNELNVRGNSSRAVIWRLEGVDIYNPNHFARVGGTGGSVTLFSQQLLANTDFFSGAFPADYGNALGAVFDARFRNGNTQQRQHSVQLSVIGLDVSTEGPFSSAGNSSYLVNYRYSTTGIVKAFVDVGNSIPTFQDLSFKLHFRLPKAATLNVFGIGGFSETEFLPSLDTAQWAVEDLADFGSLTTTLTGTIGATYSQPLGENTFFQTAMIGTGLRYASKSYYLNPDLISADTTAKSDDYEYRISWSSFINHKFGPKHTHRSGLTVHGLASNVLFARADNIFDPRPDGNLNDTIRVGRGQSMMVNAYSRSQFSIHPKLKVNLGLHAMYLGLTNELSIEPRLGIRYQLRPRQSLSFGYGLHSQMEPFYTYLVEGEDDNGRTRRVNDDIRFNKAHHLVLGYRLQFNDALRLGVEVYYQHQFNLVVGEELPISRVGAADFFFEKFELNNGGTGRNTGIEVALERTFEGGYYFLLNGSLFEATYVANDGKRRPSQFDNGLIGNGVIGKEWSIGKKKGKANLLNANIALSYSGAQYYTPVDLQMALDSGKVQTDYLNPNSAFQDPLFFLDASIVLQQNRAKYSSQLSLQVRNVLNQRPLTRQWFDRTRRELANRYGSGIIPVIAWRIQF
ncbi:MAG: TonB-dependent receptor [Bacteroidota bacterium]